jgi:DMSO/TMAO reductase YedYZ molybdopterin-dependent catalytic subunit
VKSPLRFSWHEFEALPQVEVVADMHCVTSWSKLDNVWRGVQAKHLTELAGPEPEARFVSVVCNGGYTTNAQLAELYEEDALFATHHNGEPLTTGHGPPVRLVIPRL